MGDQVTVGPFTIIEDGVTVGAGTMIGPHVTIRAGTTIGQNCRLYQYCSIGEVPQDLKYAGEPTQTLIGDRVTIREYVTINRGTAAHGQTEIGNDVLLMTGVHVAHDCQIGNSVIFANLVTLGGHVLVEDWASLGGGVLVHQFCHVGQHSFIGGGFRIVQDVPPFILAAEEPLKYKGINRIGLRRRGFSQEDLTQIKRAYRLFFRSGLPRLQAVAQMKETQGNHIHVQSILRFIAESDRGII
ncbi:MAG: acyl-ACP--UDP-N-acetylglucosamine O-acyltransferase [Fidelibacterota bacterium]